MLADKAYTSEKVNVLSKVRAYAAFSKLRLAALVVVSAIAGYMLAAPTIDSTKMIALILGGFLVTAASNGFNQIIEREHDAKMKRTENRPLPKGQMSVLEGIIVASLFGAIGIFALWNFLNPLSGILGFLALFMYVAIYTPLKRITPWAVFVGAFPGAIPPMLGFVAHEGSFGFEPGLVFMIQFIWQFPHFWAIAWKIDDDYKKAGFSLLPSKKRDKSSAFQIMLYSLFMIPTSMLPWVMGMTGTVSLIIAVILGALFFWQSTKLYYNMEMKDATRLMFASFIYLPILQFAYVFDKVIF